MAITYIFGAGASHSYDDSPSSVHPPLASGFFNAYRHLKISEDFEVRVGDIVNYARDKKGIQHEHFAEFDPNVEEFMTEVDDLIRQYSALIPNRADDPELFAEFAHLNKVYDQMIFLFAHVLNEIQNGPPSKAYSAVVNKCTPADTLITFNWDTLLDRVLLESRRWQPDTGYGISFRNILEADWRLPKQEHSDLLLLKLHGSTNWLVNYVTRNFQSGEREMLRKKEKEDGMKTMSADFGFRVEKGKLIVDPQIRDITPLTSGPIPSPPQPEAKPSCFGYSNKPYRSYKNRFRPGYEPFSYFFPPNDPYDDVPMMPLLVAPTKVKLYEEFAHIFESVWAQAEKRLMQSDRIVVIGYSFPPTDKRIIQLLADVVRQNNSAQITLVNPDAEQLAFNISERIGCSKEHIVVGERTFQEYLSH